MTSEASNWIIDPREFFRDKVSTALSNQNLKVCEEIEFYLVNLLCGFIAPEKLKTALGELDLIDTPLAIIFKHALEAPPERQLKLYKVMGDTSLYMSGYFQDYFNRKTYDMSYYITLGAQAYNHLAGLVKHQKQGPFRDVYTHLSENFPALVDVVAEVADQSGMSGDSNLLALYDRWSKSQSERLRKKLVDKGIDPVPSNTRDAQ